MRRGDGGQERRLLYRGHREGGHHGSEEGREHRGGGRFGHEHEWGHQPRRPPPRGRGPGPQEALPRSIEQALRAPGGAILCNAWTITLDESVRAWGYPLSIREVETEKPVEERKERRKVIAELLKALTGMQLEAGRDRPRRTLSRGAQHSEQLRWLIVYNERIRRLVDEERTREVAVREGDAPAKMYSVKFGDEKELTGAAWRFYFFAAIISVLEAANFRRAAGQYHYLQLTPEILRRSTELKGLDATLIQSEKNWLIKMSRHDRKLRQGTLEQLIAGMDHKRAQHEFRDRICVAVHRGTIYRILDITDETADRKTFMKEGAPVTVAKYFEDTYGERVMGKQLVEAKLLRGGAKPCFLPINLLRIFEQIPQPTGAVKKPKSAAATLSEYTRLMNELLTNQAVKEQMSELKIKLGENNLPVDVKPYTTELAKLMNDNPAYGTPSISWGVEELATQKGTQVPLQPNFSRAFFHKLAFRHKVPLNARWLLVTCSASREHEGTSVSQVIIDTVKHTKAKDTIVDMDQPEACEEFVAAPNEWTKGQVEQTKRKLRDLLIKYKGFLRGAIVVLAYDGDEVNDRVRVAAKQVSLQAEFPVQCCKISTVRHFKSMPGDKSQNMWWGVYTQFQTKIVDEARLSGVPWVAENLLAPIQERKGSVTDLEVVRAIGIAVNSFGPQRSRSAIIGIVGARNIEHTQFISHIGASASTNFRGGVVKDMARHFQPFWDKFCMHLNQSAKQLQVGLMAHYRVPPVHLLVYRSAPSGSSQIKEILENEVVALRSVIENELGSFSFSPETNELTLGHPMAAAFPYAKFRLTMNTCPAVDEARYKHRAEELKTHTRLTDATMLCARAHEDSTGTYKLTFKVENEAVPFHRHHGLLLGVYVTQEPTPLKVKVTENTGSVVLPDTNQTFTYAKANSKWIASVRMQFTASPEEPLAKDSPTGELVPQLGHMPKEAVLDKCPWTSGTTVYLRRIVITQVVQHVYLNVMINPHRPASPMKFFLSKYGQVQGLDVGTYIDSGPIIPVSPDTGKLEQKFLVGTADPTRGSPSASEFHVITNDSDWSKHYLAVVSFKLSHMYYNWGGTVKHPHLLQMALAIVRQHQIYIASESGYGLDSEFEDQEQSQSQVASQDDGSSEEGEEPEPRERFQKRRHDGGRSTFVAERSRDAEEQAEAKVKERDFEGFDEPMLLGDLYNHRSS
ncbi:hypothetical protein Efla_002013 [Eimeria flavescens]